MTRPRTTPRRSHTCRKSRAGSAPLSRRRVSVCDEAWAMAPAKHAPSKTVPEQSVPEVARAGPAWAVPSNCIGIVTPAPCETVGPMRTVACGVFPFRLRWKPKPHRAHRAIRSCDRSENWAGVDPLEKSGWFMNMIPRHVFNRVAKVRSHSWIRAHDVCPQRLANHRRGRDVKVADCNWTSTRTTAEQERCAYPLRVRARIAARIRPCPHAIRTSRPSCHKNS